MADTPCGRPTGFAHMLLKVADIARSERFYVDLLGFTVRAAKPLPDGRPFVLFHQGLALTSGALAGLHAVTASPGRGAEVAVLVAANLVATALRFLLYRTWVFGGPRPQHAAAAAGPLPATGPSIQPEGSIH